MAITPQAPFTSKAATNRAQRRDEVAARLLAATQELVAGGESFAGLSVDRLTTTAGISRSTFYLYFPDKADLLRTLTDPLIAELTAAGAQWWAHDTPLTVEELRELLDGITETYRAHAVLIGALFDMTSHDPAIHDYVDETMERATTELSDHITAGQRHGWIEPRLPPRETAAWLTWMIERGHRRFLTTDDAALAEDVTAALVDFVWHALYSVGARGESRSAPKK